MGGWGKPRLVLDPLALLLRERYASRSELARVSGLGYQTLRTYTDGLWTRDRPPSTRVLTALARAVDHAELDTAVRAALAGRPARPLTFGQQVLLEALAGFDDDRLTGAAPYIHELVRDFTPPHEGEPGPSGERPRGHAAATIREATAGDLEAVLALAAARRVQYETFQPVFWKPAADAEVRQRPYLAELIDDDSVITLVAVLAQALVGFVVARLAPAPPVYDPGGLTCMVDDFTVASSDDWPTLGVDLLNAVRHAVSGRGAAQLVVVTAQLDEAKRAALAASGLGVASEWWVGRLTD